MFLVELVEGAATIPHSSYVIKDGQKEGVEMLLRGHGFSKKKNCWSSREIWQKQNIRGVQPGRRVNITRVSGSNVELILELVKFSGK